jgi:cell division protein FtsL
MILRTVNLILLVGVMVSAFSLISKRYQYRTDYATLAGLRAQADQLNMEYTKLQLEEGTYSSNLVLQDVALNKLKLVQPDKAHIIEMK